jgi:DNA-binding NtrC family response regulator
MRILVIDDGDDIMRFCRQFLSGRHDLFHASNGRQAIEKIKKGGIDLLLLDKWFRGISESDLIGDKEDVRNEGLCILEKIKEIAPKIPVVMITAYGDEETHRR